MITQRFSINSSLSSPGVTSSNTVVHSSKSRCWHRCMTADWTEGFIQISLFHPLMSFYCSRIQSGIPHFSSLAFGAYHPLSSTADLSHPLHASFLWRFLKFFQTLWGQGTPSKYSNPRHILIVPAALPGQWLAASVNWTSSTHPL